MKYVKIPTLAWYGDCMETLTFPDDWDVIECHMVGYNKRALTHREIKASFTKPFGTDRISEIARSRKNAIVIFDDMTRGTPVAKLVPYIIDELKKGGVVEGRIRFIMALGAHGARNRMDFVKKLGSKMVEKYAVYNHNPFENCKYVGKTSNGTPIEVNKEVIKCDLKIGVGSITPHPMAGFSGGSKIILPGVTSLRTIYFNHCVLGGYGPKRTPHESTGLGVDNENIIYSDAEEAAQMIGLDIKVDVLMNEKREITEVFVGDPVAQRKKTLEAAKKHYLTYPSENCDVVIANCYTKANEADTALWAGLRSIKDGGTVVLICHTPEGQVVHYLYGKFGEKMGGRGWEDEKPLQKIGNLIIYSRYKEIDPHLPIWSKKYEGKVFWAKTWEEVTEKIKAIHKASIKVAVYPCAELQYPIQNK